MPIAHSQSRCRQSWHPAFLRLLPKIEAYIVPAFQRLRADAREDAIHEAIGQAFLAFVVLKRRRRDERIYPTPLARYAICRVRRGSTLGNSRNSRDVLSRFSQRRRGFIVRRLQPNTANDGGWREGLVENRRTPIIDQVWFRIDFPDWLSRLSPRSRRIAESMASGNSTRAVGREFGVSAARISQLRHELHESWEAFHEGLAQVTK